MRQGALAFVVSMTAAGPATAFDATPIGEKLSLGLGLKVGEPTLITGKLWLTNTWAIDFQSGWAVTHPGPRLGADLLFHFRNIAPKIRQFELAVHVGGGVGFGLWNRDNLYHQHDDPWVHSHRHDVQEPLATARLLGGIAMIFRKAPVEVFVEAATPTVVFFSGDPSPWGVGGGVGGRFYF